MFVAVIDLVSVEARSKSEPLADMGRFWREIERLFGFFFILFLGCFIFIIVTKVNFCAVWEIGKLNLIF